jgi:limonene-1,2-epoxide hydrolase
MADQPTKHAAGTTLPQVVEKLLYALPDEHYDARAAALDDDVVDHNVGPPMVRGRHRTVKFLRRPDAGFDMKIHRIAAEGTSAATERTEVINDGPLDYTDRYQEVMHRGSDLGAVWSPPFHLNIWTARRATYGCVYVLDPPHDASSTGDWKAEDVA